MALTLPVEELTRLQVTFRLSLPDDLLTFEMLSNSTSASPPAVSLSGYKLHLKGSRDGSGLCLKVWAHYEGGSQSDQHACRTGIDDDRPELHSPQSTEASSLYEAPVDVDNNSLNTGNSIGLYNSCPNPLWYEYQEARGTVPLADTYASVQPMNGFDGNTWYKDNTTALGMMENVCDTGLTASQIGTCFGKQNLSDYHESDGQSMSYQNLLPSVDAPSAQSASVPNNSAHTKPELRILPTPISHSPSMDSPITPSSDTSSSTITSPISSPDCSSSSRPYRCLEPTCDRWFKRDYTRKVHMLTHRRKDRKPFGCTFPGCPERFSRKHDRLRHEVGRHGLQSEWTCQPCHRFFSSRATMERHIFDKHGDDVSKAREA